MSNEISVNELAAPEFSDQALKILSEREDLPVEFSLGGMLQFAEETTDVPIEKRWIAK